MSNLTQKRVDLAKAKKEAKIKQQLEKKMGAEVKDNDKTSSISYAYKEESNICSSYSEI